MTITEFIEARLKDTEGDAYYLQNVGVRGSQYGTVNESLERVPEAVHSLAAAIRVIMALHIPVHRHGYVPGTPKVCASCGDQGDGDDFAIDYPCPTLCAVAAIWADEDGWQEEWR